MFDFFFKINFKNLNKCAHGTARKSSRNPVKSKSINQSLICLKFQRCTSNQFENLLKILAFVNSKETCLTGSSVPTPLKLTIKTPEQHLLCCSCAFIVDFEQV